MSLLRKELKSKKSNEDEDKDKDGTNLEPLVEGMVLFINSFYFYKLLRKSGKRQIALTRSSINNDNNINNDVVVWL